MPSGEMKSGIENAYLIPSSRFATGKFPFVLRLAATLLVLIGALIAALVLIGVLVGAASAQDFKKQVIYQIVTDRFFNGDTTNDNPSQSSGLFDSTKTNWQLYWGGDLAGIKHKISYLSGMGVTAICISPPVDTINVSIPDGNNNATAPYHGYAAPDMNRIQ